MDPTLVVVFLALVVASYGGVCVYMSANQARMVYNPVSTIDFTPADRGLAYQPVRFSAEDRIELDGWWIPAARPRGAILYCHGNTGNMAYRMETFDIFARLGYSVFAFDYRGYGLSGGKPDEEGTYRDVWSAWQYLRETIGIPERDIVLFGRSLGGPIAAWLAARTQPKALVLESTFISMPQLAQELYPMIPARWLSRIDYPTQRWLLQASCPVLVVHSSEDELIPFHHGQSLHDNYANGTKMLLEIRGRHNDGFVYSGSRYTDGLTQFFDSLDGHEVAAEPGVEKLGH